MKSTGPKLFLLLLATNLLLSCRKEVEKDGIHLFSAEDKELCFQSGSYWVFKNDSDQTIDSLVITDVKRDFYWSPPPVHGYPGDKHEFFTMNIRSYGPENYYYNDYVTRGRFIRRNGGGDYGQLGQPIFNDGSFNGLSVINTDTSVTLNGNTFNHAYKFKVTATQQYQHVFNYDTYLYYHIGTGFIKKETVIGPNNVESWSIIRWSVTQI